MTLSECPRPESDHGGDRENTVQTDARALTKLLLERPGLGLKEVRSTAKAHLNLGCDRVNSAMVLLKDGFEGWKATNQGDERKSSFIIVKNAEETSS